MIEYQGVNWTHFLTRPTDVFHTVASMNLWEGGMMREALGWDYSNIIQIVRNGFIENYVDADHLQRGREFLAKRIDEDHGGVIELLERGSSGRERIIATRADLESDVAIMTKENAADIYQKYIDGMNDYLLYCVAIAYFILNSSAVIEENVSDSSKYEAVYKAAEVFRKESLYPDYVREVYPALAKRAGELFGLEPEVFRYVLLAEIVPALRDGNIDLIRELASERMDTFAFMYLDLVPQQVDIKELLEHFPSVSSDVNELSGTTAFAGKVQGIARPVFTPADMERFNEGDILITIQSSPSFMAAIRKAGAIVSDEGGMACHAAIISREMKIPAVVGTKHATQVFKDGDTVEVDADNGIVRKV